MKKRIEIIIKGRVQGVTYRNNTRRKAEELELNGWVRNEEDGSVKIVAEGKENNLKKLSLWCHEGPGFAKVEDVVVEWKENKNEFDEFEIRY